MAKTAPQKARETKFVQCAVPLAGKWFLLRMVVAARSHGGLDLPQLAVFAHRLNAAIAVTGQAFKTRFTPYAVEGCKAMLVTAWPLRLPGGSWPLVSMRQSFTAVYLLAAATICLPESLKQEFPGCGGGAAAALKRYLRLDWLTGGQ